MTNVILAWFYFRCAMGTILKCKKVSKSEKKWEENCSAQAAEFLGILAVVNWSHSIRFISTWFYLVILLHYNKPSIFGGYTNCLLCPLRKSDFFPQGGIGGFRTSGDWAIARLAAGWNQAHKAFPSHGNPPRTTGLYFLGVFFWLVLGRS